MKSNNCVVMYRAYFNQFMASDKFFSFECVKCDVF